MALLTPALRMPVRSERVAQAADLRLQVGQCITGGRQATGPTEFFQAESSLHRVLGAEIGCQSFQAVRGTFNLSGIAGEKPLFQLIE